jgi:hypothetical protein
VAAVFCELCVATDETNGGEKLNSSRAYALDFMTPVLFSLAFALVLPLLHLHFYNFARKDERGEFSSLRVNSKRLIIAFSRQAVQTLCLELATQDTDIIDKARLN